MPPLHRLLQPFLVVLAVVLGCCAGALRAQGTQMPIPDKLERAVETDAQGLQQWAKWAEACPNCQGKKEAPCVHCARWDGDSKNCPECKGAKTAPCRACAGAGTFPDPLEKLHCPGCQGAGAFACNVCGGFGTQKVEGSGEKRLPCVGCRGAAAFPCAVCSGARLVDPAPLKPSMKDAPVAALKKAKDQVNTVLAALQKFTPTGKNARKETKEFVKLMTPAGGTLPPIKRSLKAVEDMMGKVEAGSVYMGHEERAATALTNWKKNTEYYLQMQARILELALARAEHNAKTLAELKGNGKK